MRPRMYLGEGVTAFIRHTLQWGIERSTLCAVQLVIEREGEISMFFEGTMSAPPAPHLLACLDREEHDAPRRRVRSGTGLELRRSILWVAASELATIELNVAGQRYRQTYREGVAVGPPTESPENRGAWNSLRSILEPSLFSTLAVDARAIAFWYTHLNVPHPASVLIGRIHGQTYDLGGSTT